MTDRPLILETGVGPVGLVLSEADQGGGGGALLLHGGGTRSGNNGLWARLARTLARSGVSALRLDYPGRGESLLAHPGQRAAVKAAGEALGWLRERTEAGGVAIVGNCGGARLAIRLAADGQAEGLALVRPYLRRVPPVGAVARPLWKWSIRVQRHLGWSRVRRAALDPSLFRDLRTALGSTSTMVLVGERDPWARDAALIRQLNDAVEIQIVPGLALHGFPTAAAQQETVDRLVSWAQRRAVALRSP